MNIGCLVDTISRNAGGLFESVRRLAQSLESVNGNVRVFSLIDEHTRSDVEKWAPLIVQTYKPLIHGSGYAPDLLPAMQAADFDVLLTNGLWKYGSVVSRSWARRTGRPYIIHPHGMLDPWAVKNSRWKKRIAALLFENAHLRGASCLRALCESEAQSIRSFGLKNPICTIPNGIDLPDLGIDRQPPCAEFETEQKILFYLGRLHPKKNLEALLHAWARVTKAEGRSQRSGEWVLAIAGWDQAGYANRLRKLIQELDLKGSVRLTGALFGEAKAAAYQCAKAFVLPSLSEGLPMTVLEAWAFAKPVLMTPECNLPEGFRAGAALSLNSDATSIAQGLRTLFEMSEGHLKAMGGRGRDLARKSFNWQTIGREMKAVCEWLVDGSPPPPCVRFN